VRGQQATSSEATALAVFRAALHEDATALDARADEAGTTREGFRALAGLLPMPFLHACARRWARAVPRTWAEGYCPVCGAWPAFAEVRGVERSRHLRCGRCATGWPMPVLCCTYCGTIDHGQLGSLVSEAGASRFALDVCHGCSGYLKTCTTLQPTPPAEMIATDLSSVEFDLIAIDRGYRRPSGPGYPLRPSLAEAGARAPLADA
jgi:FdhE protein